MAKIIQPPESSLFEHTLSNKKIRHFFRAPSEIFLKAFQLSLLTVDFPSEVPLDTCHYSQNVHYAHHEHTPGQLL